MKTLIKKDRVTHNEFGNGTVVSVLKGGASIEVDFNGTLRTCRVSELDRVKSNSYTPKPTVTNVLAEVQKLQDIYLVELNELRKTEFLSESKIVQMAEKKILINRLENILQGKSNKQ